LALHVIAEAQKKGGIAAFIDAEHALDVKYAGHLGVKMMSSSSHNRHRRAGLEIAEILVEVEPCDVIVHDSVAALFPKPRLKARWEMPTWSAGQADVSGSEKN